MAVLLAISGAGSMISCRVHPVALFSICDAYIRRKQEQRRVIGTLLGSITDGVFEIKGCYVVPHTENMEQVGLLASITCRIVTSPSHLHA